MGFLDKAIETGKDLAEKAEDLAADHKDQVKDGIDKVEDLAEGALGGTFKDQIEGAGDKAAGFVDDLKK